MALPASDNFNRSLLGSNWSTTTSGLQIVGSQRMYATTSAYGALRWNADTFPNDQYSQATIEPWTAGGIGVAVRMNTSNVATYYRAIIGSDSRCRIEKVVTGTVTTLATDVSASWVSGDVLTLQVVGTALSVYRNSTLHLSTTDASIASGGAGIAGFSGTNGFPDSGWIDDWSGGVALVPPTAPSGLSATTGSATVINLAWTDNSSDETGFKIERSPTGSGSWVEIATTASGVVTYANTGLTPSTTYYYRVRAYNGTGNSSYTSNANATTAALPTAPSSLSATVISYAQVNLAWTDNSGNETGFKIERSTSGGAYTQIGTTNANVATYSDTGMVDNASHNYRVRSYNANGDSSYSNVANAVTPLGPARVRVEIAFALGGDNLPNYQDMTSRLRDDSPLIIKRGRQSEVSRIEAGRLTLTLDNRDRALDPLNTASPYYPNVKPRRHIRVSEIYNGVTYYLFTGFCRFAAAWGTNDHVCQVEASDRLDTYANTPLVSRIVRTWTPTANSSPQTLNITDGISTGQIMARLTEGTSGTQTVTVTGTRKYDNSSASSTFVLTPENASLGVTATPVYTSVITQYTTAVTGDTHKPIEFFTVPAFSNGDVANRQYSDDHILDILEYAGLGSLDRDLSEGATVMTSWTPSRASSYSRALVASGSDTVLKALEMVATTERGLVYIRGDGVTVFEARWMRGQSYFPSAPLLGSGSGEIPYRDPTFDDGDSFVINRVRIKCLGDEYTSYADGEADSLTDYGSRVYDQGGMLMATDAAANTYARHAVYHRQYATPRVTSVTIDANTTNYTTLFGLDISDVVVARLRPPGVTTPYDRPSFVEGVEWRITRSAYTLKLALSPATLGNDLYRAIGGSGTSFPASPATGTVFYRTDVNLKCYYNGTEWVTVDIYEVPFQSRVALPSASALVMDLPGSSPYNRRLIGAAIEVFVNTTNNGSNFWSISVLNGVNGTTLGSVTTTAAFAANAWNSATISLTAVSPLAVNLAVLTGTTGAPGTLYIAATLRYRLIVT